jgi:hypothetical protein
LALTKKIATKSEMAGRPANGTKQFLVQLLPADVARIDALVGTYKRSEFIRIAVERELEHRKG